MSDNRHYRTQMNREQISQLVTPKAFDSASKLFYTEDGFLGFGWASHPITGASEGTADKLNMLMSMQYPPGTTMSFCLWASPDIDGYLSNMLGLRAQSQFGNHEVLEHAIRDKEKFFRRGTTEKVNDRVYALVRDFVVIVSVKMPVSKNAQPSDKEWQRAIELRTAVEKGLEGIGLGPLPLTDHLYLHIVGSMLNWSTTASWRDGGPDYDPTSVLNEQMFDLDTGVNLDENGLWLGDKRVKVLSPKRYPDVVQLPVMQLLIGDVRNGREGIAGNFLTTMNIYFPDPAAERERLDRERTMVTYQAMGPIAALSSALRQKKLDHDIMADSLDAGDRPIKMQHSFILFEDSDEKATAASMAMKSYYRDMHYQVQDDRFVALPILINAIPFGADGSSNAVKFLKRHKDVPSGTAAHLAPILSDWKGTTRPVMSYLSRSGQLMGLDLFESSTNFNFIVAAQSGAGKSFWANDMLVSYLSIGAKVYVIDVGRSYQKLTGVVGGEFLVFSKDSHLCLNPFELVQDFEEEGSMLVDMLKAMAAPTTKLGDWETACLQKTVSELWDVKGNDLTIDDVADVLSEHDDGRAKDVGYKLYPFTSKGEYGKWFVGKNNVRFDRNLTVLELEELKGKPHLQVIVLLQLIYQITQDLYLGDRGIPKIILIDESWDLFNKGDVAAFMVSAYRRARKYNGSIGIITQSISDLYANEAVGLPMIENSAWMFLLGQKSESVDFMQKSGRISLNPSGFDLLKTVQTVRGRYSEIFIYTSSYNGAIAAGIARLIVPRFSQLLYSTDARELSKIKLHQDCGKSLHEAIEAVILAESN